MPLNDSAAVDSTQLVACETGPSLIALSTSEVFGDHGETSRRSDSSHVSTYVRKSKHNIWNMYNYINTYISNSHTYPISIYILHIIYVYIYIYVLFMAIHPTMGMFKMATSQRTDDHRASALPALPPPPNRSCRSPATQWDAVDVYHLGTSINGDTQEWMVYNL